MLLSFFTALMGRIEDVIVKTILSVEFSVGTACRMFVPYKSCCFGKYCCDLSEYMRCCIFLIANLAKSNTYPYFGWVSCALQRLNRRKHTHSTNRRFKKFAHLLCLIAERHMYVDLVLMFIHCWNTCQLGFAKRPCEYWVVYKVNNEI